MLQRFLPSKYYLKGHCLDIDAPTAYFLPPAKSLIAQYYQKKYGIKLVLLTRVSTFLVALGKVLKNKEGDERIGFLIGGFCVHSFPLIYIREKGEEALFYPDSSGHDPEVYASLKRQTSLAIYSISKPRQHDKYSCVADAFVILRDSMVIENGHYRLPDLLQQLKAQAWFNGAYLETKLPTPLLKCSQTSRFMREHKQASEISANNALESFLEPYARQIAQGTKINDYLRAKGIKLAARVEVQFYLNQLQSLFLEQWTDKLELEFRSQAKLALAEQGDCFINPSDTGLFQLATGFCTALRSNRLTEIFTRSYQPACIANEKLHACANFILELIRDNEYWKAKTFWGVNPPEGIVQMQKALATQPATLSLSGKVKLLQSLAKERLESDSFISLLSTFENRDTTTKLLYSFFTKDWLQSKLLDTLREDWRQFQLIPKDPPLASMEHFNKRRVHC